MILKQAKSESDWQTLIKLLSTYQTLTLNQLYLFFPHLEKKSFPYTIRKLCKSRRAVYNPKTGLLCYGTEYRPDIPMVKALWVLLDFLDNTIYHTVSDTPVLLTFFTRSDAFDIIHIPEGSEDIYNLTLSSTKDILNSRLVLIDNKEQIPHIDIPAVAAFCVVEEDGTIQYYKTEGENTA